jgi:hypothetical protein
MAPVLVGERTQREAGRLLHRTARQIRRLVGRLNAEGDVGVIHRLRGRPSNARIDPERRRLILAAYRADYADFGPTLAAEKLAERNLAVTGQTLRLWLLGEGLWQRKRRREVHRQRRARRECFGELVQADGSLHDWLEGRGPWITLLVMIDDATSKAVARFAAAECTAGYLDLLGRYLRKHGRMGALYTDRHSIFWGEGHGDDPRPARTQVNRALGELGIQWIAAHSPQAKGRVERFNGTAQDRLVKELRLAGACDIEQSIAVLEKTFLPWFNRRCTVKPASRNDAHRSIQPAMNLAGILSVQETRTVANDYTIRLDNRVYQLPPPPLPGLRRGKVIIERRLDGSMHVRFNKSYLRFRLVQDPAAEGLGAPPPDPRSLPLGRIPAGPRKKQGCVTKATQPSAVHPTVKRSGRTPALPYPPDGKNTVTPKTPYRPTPNHPWR